MILHGPAARTITTPSRPSLMEAPFRGRLRRLRRSSRIGLLQPVCLRRLLECFYKLDECPFVVIAQPGLFLKEIGAEVVPAIHDEIWAFAEIKHLACRL